MPRLLTTPEIIEMRTRVHPDVHDDTCDVCAVFSTMAAMILLLDIHADTDDEPRDDHGRWTSDGGGDGGDSVVPLSETDSKGDVDVKVDSVVAAKAMQFSGINVDDVDVDDTDSTVASNTIAGSAKSAVSSDIASRMGTKYDQQLMGTVTLGSHGMNLAQDVPGGPMPITSVEPAADHLTDRDVWLKPLGKGMGPDYVGNLDVMEKTNAEYYEGLLASGKSDEVTGDNPIIAERLREQGVSNLVTNWAGTSNDHSVQSLAMQESAVKEFGLTGTVDWDDKVSGDGLSYDFIDNNGEHHTLEDQVQSEVDKNGEMYQAFLRAQYDNTQQFFKDNGITSVTAYRGFNFSADEVVPDWADPEDNDIDEDNPLIPHWNADVPLRPLSSFSYDPDSANNFSSETGYGAVVAGQVPVSRVLSTAVTGIGCLGEREMVLLGGTDKWTVR